MRTAAPFSAPTTGRRAAMVLPPPSAVQVTSGASSESSPSRSPVAAAVMNCSVIRAVFAASTGSKRLGRARPCSRGGAPPGAPPPRTCPPAAARSGPQDTAAHPDVTRHGVTHDTTSGKAAEQSGRAGAHTVHYRS
ncbi:hypothetical protein GCM10010300_82030 [Streptomyces olivaceoviridis]|nr:hypothetical protein GCM10010300_82030 [Streptomyces olivaceoviridis]